MSFTVEEKIEENSVKESIQKPVEKKAVDEKQSIETVLKSEIIRNHSVIDLTGVDFGNVRFQFTVQHTPRNFGLKRVLNYLHSRDYVRYNSGSGAFESGYGIISTTHELPRVKGIIEENSLVPEEIVFCPYESSSIKDQKIHVFVPVIRNAAYNNEDNTEETVSALECSKYDRPFLFSSTTFVPLLNNHKANLIRMLHSYASWKSFFDDEDQDSITQLGFATAMMDNNLVSVYKFNTKAVQRIYGAEGLRVSSSHCDLSDVFKEGRGVLAVTGYAVIDAHKYETITAELNLQR